MEACRRKFQLWENKTLFLVRWEWSSVIQDTSAVCGLAEIDFTMPWQLLNLQQQLKFPLKVSFPLFIVTWPTHGHQRAESNCWTHFLLDREMPEKTCSILLLCKCCLCVKSFKNVTCSDHIYANIHLAHPGLCDWQKELWIKCIVWLQVVKLFIFNTWAQCRCFCIQQDSQKSSWIIRVYIVILIKHLLCL